MKKAVVAALGALLLLALTACGSSGKAKPQLSTEEQKAADNISKTFESQSNGSLTKTEASCFATNFVDKVGLDKLKAAKLITADDQMNQTGETFTAEISGKFADAFLGCVDYTKRQAEQIAKADSTIDQATLETCLKTAMPTDYVKKLIVASQTQASDSTTLTADAAKKLTDCKASATKKK